MKLVYKHNLRKTEYLFLIDNRCTARALEDWHDILYDFTPKICVKRSLKLYSIMHLTQEVKVKLKCDFWKL